MKSFLFSRQVVLCIDLLCSVLVLSVAWSVVLCSNVKCSVRPAYCGWVLGAGRPQCPSCLAEDWAGGMMSELTELYSRNKC